MQLVRSMLAIGLCALIAGCADSDVPLKRTAEPAAALTPAPAAVPSAQSAVAAAEPVPAAPSPPPAARAATGSEPTYSVDCQPAATTAEQCQVDKDTYVGWRTFAGQCQVCHGGSALGSTFAPNLLDRFHERVDYARFVEVVHNGFRGQVGAMPAWKGNPNVEPHIDAIYRYLKARADGVLPPGRPARKP